MKSARLTLIDVLVGLCTFGLLIGGVVVPVATTSRESSSRIKCSSNLRQIGLAMKMYANEEVRTNAFPRTRCVPNLPPVFYTGANVTNPFIEGGPQPNDVTAAMFLILRTQDLTPHVFVCPVSDADWFRPDEDKTINDHSNFRGQQELSYGLTNPYASDDAISKGFAWNDSISGDYAIMADIGSGDLTSLTIKPNVASGQQRLLNSPNHYGDGQNVLYADGHADWTSNVWVGTKNDNIYTFGGPPDEKGNVLTTGFIGSPTSGEDSVMLPSWDLNIAKPPNVISRRHYLQTAVKVTLGGIVVITAGIACWVMIRGYRKSSKTPDAT